MKYMKSTFIYIGKCVRNVRRRTRLYSISASSTREGDGGKQVTSANSSMNSKGLKKLAFGVAGVLVVAGLTATISRRKRNASGLTKIEPLSPQQELLLASDEENYKVEQVGSEDIGAGPDEAYQSDVIVDAPATVMQESTFEVEHPVIDNLDNLSVSDSDMTNLSPDHQEGISISREVENSKLPVDINSGLGLTKIEPLSPQQELLLASDEENYKVEQVESEDIGAGPDEAYQSDVIVYAPATVIQDSTFEVEHPVIVNLDNLSVSDSDMTNLSPDHQEGIFISREVENSKLPLDINSGLGLSILIKDVSNSNFSQLLVSANKALSGKTFSMAYSVEKMAREARLDPERLRALTEEENNALMRGLASVESESKNHAIVTLQNQLEVPLSVARALAEEAEFARQRAKAVKEAIDRLEKHGSKVIADSDLREDVSARVASVGAGKQSIVDETVSSAESWVDKLKEMAGEMRGKSIVVIDRTISKMTSLISSLKERTAKELQGVVVSKASESVQGSQ